MIENGVKNNNTGSIWDGRISNRVPCVPSDPANCSMASDHSAGSGHCLCHDQWSGRGRHQHDGSKPVGKKTVKTPTLSLLFLQPFCNRE